MEMGSEIKATRPGRLARAKARVAAATVRLTSTGGQGVLAPGGLILTAAHCVDWDVTAGVQDKHHVETVRARSGARAKVRLLAVEPLADIAVLGSLDDQVAPEEAMGYARWLDRAAPPVRVREGPEVGKPLRVHILAHRGR
jgi:hypothetical protein